MNWLLRTMMICFLMLSASFGTVASAQETDALPSLEELRDQGATDALVARMSDEDIRAILMSYLEAGRPASEVATDPVTVFDRIADVWQAFLVPGTRAVERLPVLVEKQSEAIGRFIGQQAESGGVAMLLGTMALILAFAYLVERAARYLVLRRSAPDVAQNRDSLSQTLRFLSWRLFHEIVGLIVFFLVVRTVGRAVLSPEQLAFAAPFVTLLIWIPRVAAAISRFLLAPHRPEFRLVTLEDRWARFLHRNVVLLFVLVGFNIFILGFNTAQGVPPAATGLGFWLDSSVYLFIVVTAWLARAGLREMMLGRDPDRTALDEKIATAFPFYMIAVSLLMWATVSTLAGLGYLEPLLRGAHYTTMFWLFAVPVFDTAIRGLVNHMVPRVPQESAATMEAYRQTKRSYIHIGRVIVAGFVIVLIARVWGIDLVSIIQDRPGLTDNFFAFLLTLVVGDLAYQGVTLWFTRLLAREVPEIRSGDTDGEMVSGGKSRLSTVLPLVLVIARGAVLAIFGLLAVGNLGVDITPLLAGAGVIGLAIGFGAQKLVTDIVSGIFFLIDDAFRIGEYVDVGGTMGAVEKISVRSMTLRHHRGALHTIPYGEVSKLTNFSRDWVIMKLMFRVEMDTDPNKVKKIFKKIGAEMMQDPLYKDDFLQPFKSQGVFDIDEVGIVVRGKFMAKPGKQFMIRKELYNRIKDAFAESGIEFARREVRVALPHSDHRDLRTTEEEMLMAATAAEGAASATGRQE